jgi:hypothetical protein
LPTAAVEVVVTENALGWLLLGLTELKLFWSLSAVNAVFSSETTNETAEYPEMRASFFEILALIAFCCGTFSALTKL